MRKYTNSGLSDSNISLNFSATLKYLSSDQESYFFQKTATITSIFSLICFFIRELLFPPDSAQIKSLRFCPTTTVPNSFPTPVLNFSIAHFTQSNDSSVSEEPIISKSYIVTSFCISNNPCFQNFLLDKCPLLLHKSTSLYSNICIFINSPTKFFTRK